MAKIIKTNTQNIDEIVNRNVQRFLTEALAGDTLGSAQPTTVNYATPAQATTPAQPTNQQAETQGASGTEDITGIKETLVDILTQLSSNPKAFSVEGLLQTIQNCTTAEQILKCLNVPQGGLRTQLVNAYQIYAQNSKNNAMSKNDYVASIGQIFNISSLPMLVNELHTFLVNSGFIMGSITPTTVLADYTGAIKLIKQEIIAFRQNKNVITALNNKGKTCINIFDEKYNKEFNTVSQKANDLFQWFVQTVIASFFENQPQDENAIKTALPHIYTYPTQVAQENLNDINTYFQNVIADVTGFSPASNSSSISNQIFEIVAAAINSQEYFGNEMLKGEDGTSLESFKTLMSDPETINDNAKISLATYEFLTEWFGRHETEILKTNCDGEKRNLDNALALFGKRASDTSTAIRTYNKEWEKYDNQNLTSLQQTLTALRNKFNSEKERMNKVPFTVLMEEQESFYASVNNKQSFLCEDKLFVPAAQAVNNYSYNNYSSLNEGENDTLWVLDSKYAQKGKRIAEVGQEKSTIYRAISYAHRRIAELNGGEKNVTITPEIITKIMAADYMFNEVNAQKYLNDIFSTYRRADNKTKQLIAQRIQMLESKNILGTNSLFTTENNLGGEYRIELLPQNEAEFTQNIATRQKVAAKYAGPLAKAYLYYRFYVGHSSTIKGLSPQPVFVPIGVNTKAGVTGKTATSFKQVIYVPDIDGIQEVLFKNGSAGNQVKYWKLTIENETITVKSTPKDKEIYTLLFSPTSPIWELKRHPMIEEWKKSVDAQRSNYGNYDTINKAKQASLKKIDGADYKVMSLARLFKTVVGGNDETTGQEIAYDENINYGKLLSQVAVYKGVDLKNTIIFNVSKLAEYVATQIQNNPNANYRADDLEFLLRYTNVIPEQYMNIIIGRLGNTSISSRSDRHYTSGYQAKEDDNFNVTTMPTPDREKTTYRVQPVQQYGQVGQRDGKVQVSKRPNHKAVTPKKRKDRDPRFGQFNEHIQKMVSLINRMDDPNKQREYLR